MSEPINESINISALAEQADALRQVDVCLIVDTTASMGAFLNMAKRELLSMVASLSEEAGIDLQMGLVEFRDHPPQETSFVTKHYPLTSDVRSLKSSLRKLQPAGGGDSPEAVYQGLYDACEKLAWRPNSVRFGFLVGDAPPHGFAAWYRERRGEKVQMDGDAWPKGCPSGFDVDDICAAAERKRLRLFALVMGGWKPTVAAFQALADGTGGARYTLKGAKQTMAQIKELLLQEFGAIDFEQAVWEAVEKAETLDAEAVATALDCPRVKVAAAIARMGARGLWEGL